MKAIRSNAALKILAFVLSVVFGALSVANGLLALLLIENNLFTSDEASIRYKVFSYLAENTINDIINYYDCNMDYITAKAKNLDNADYWNGETMVYRSKFSPENTNVFFTVTNSDNKTVLSSAENRQDKTHLDDDNVGFVFTRSFKRVFLTDKDGNIIYEANPYSDGKLENYTSFDNDNTHETADDYTTYKSDKITEKETAEPTESSSDTDEAETVAKQTVSASTDNTSAEGVIKKEDTFTVKLFVPNEQNLSIKDNYYYASKAVSFAVSYRNSLIFLTAVYLVILVVSVLFLFISAGYTKKRPEPYAGGLHKIPFDLATLIYIALCVLDLMFAFSTGMRISHVNLEFLISVGLFYLIPVLTLIYLESLAVRIRAKGIIKNTVLYKLFAFTNNALHSAGVLFKSIFVYSLELIVLVLAILFTGFTENTNITAIFAAFLLLPITLYAVYAFVTVSAGAERFSRGNTESKINEKYLIPPFKGVARNLNSINDAINISVKEQLKSESMKTELITNVSHDLKTPLTSIVNYIDLLSKLDIEDPTAREYIEVIDRQAQRLKKLTVDIVDASKAATGNIEIHPEKLNLGMMISQMDGEYIDKLNANALTLIISVPEEPIYVNVDGRILWRVFDNIIGNVCKYSMPGTRVYLTLAVENGISSVTLRNISKAELNISPEKLTERFVRGDSSRNTEGSGLGLSIASSLTELLGGSLKIDIDGDLFKVTLSFPVEKM